VTRLSSFQGVRAVVTGASSGIGEGLALRLAEEGAAVALVARRQDELCRVAEAIEGKGGVAHVVAADLSDRTAAVEAARIAEERLAGVDLLVNNAGYGGHHAFSEWDLDDMDRMMRVNYLASLAFTRTLLPGMLARRRGWLVFVASVAGKIPTPLEAPYAASKAALLALAEAVSLEVEDAGVHVLNVCPGVIETPFFSEQDWQQLPAVARRGAVPVAGLVDRIVRALQKGRHELTYPGPIAAAYRVKALAPRFMRRQVKRATRRGS
jgi:short-subunit dehydrogenase